MAEFKRTERTITATDLRGILKYVPLFRDHCFVINLDSDLIAHENFHNVLLDLAVFRSLNIQIILVHGIGQQLAELAQEQKCPVPHPYGDGPTDQASLDLASNCASGISQTIIQGLTRNGIRCALCNAVRAKPSGIVRGQDLLHSGKVDKLDLGLLHHLLDGGTLPILSPIAYGRDGEAFRIDSDAIASEVAIQMQASKLIFMTAQRGICIQNQALTNLPVKELQSILAAAPNEITATMLNKARHALSAIRGGIDRAHILDGRLFAALLNEVFDAVGVGTMIHGDAYEAIRPARPADAEAIFSITQNAVAEDSLRHRSLDAIQAAISSYWVNEIDGSIVACMQLRPYESAEIIELSAVYVQSFYQQRGVGKKMIEFAKVNAQERGAKRLLLVTTQAHNFFHQVCGFTLGNTTDLPNARLQEYIADERNGRILFYEL
tara:strand:- start:1814 stop:3121 length:1308 start_codon:yes stop_codon:yes gene_type:complete